MILTPPHIKMEMNGEWLTRTLHPKPKPNPNPNPNPN